MSETSSPAIPGTRAAPAAETPEPEPPAAATARQWLVLAVVLVGTFMVILDSAIVNVAIPDIRSGLHTSFGGVELVVSGYTMTYACLLVTGGRLGDLFGRRRLFLAGLALFTLASLACGAAPNAAFLIGARAIQGIGAALLYPQVLAVIQTTFQGRSRATALGLFGSVIGLAAIAGQVVGGGLLALNLLGWTWRPVFLVNLPTGLAAIVAAVLVIPKDKPTAQSKLDLGGVGLSAATLLLFSVPLLEGRDLGWPWWTFACLVLAVPVGYLLLRYERRLADAGGSPLIRTDLLREPAMRYGLAIACCFLVSYAGYMLIQAVYLQSGLGYSPLKSGLTYTPSAVAFLITSLAVPRIVPILGRQILAVGYVIAALGLCGAAATAAAAGANLNPWELAPSLIVAGVGQALGLSPMIGTIISGVAPQDAGSASGMVTTTMQTGNVLGVALVGLLYVTALGTPGAGAHALAQASGHAFAITLPVSAAVLVIAAILVQRLPLGPDSSGNALIERLPGWASGFAYSMFLSTGGRAGDHLFADLVKQVKARRRARAEAAPDALGDMLAHYFVEEAQDSQWITYLARESLAFGDRPVPREFERAPFIGLKVQEMRERQAKGLAPAEFEPELLALLTFSVATYPRLLRQITRMTTGVTVDDPRFVEEWAAFLRRLGERING